MDGYPSFITNFQETVSNTVTTSDSNKPLITGIVAAVLIILFLLSSIFSGSETAYSTISPAKLHDMAEKEHKFANLINKQVKKYNQLLSTILIGNNLVNVASSALTSYVLSLYFAEGDPLTVIISTAVVTPILVLFGEITPKLIAKYNPERYLKIFCLFNELMFWLFFPLTYPISKLSKNVYVTNSEEDIKSMLSLAQEEGVLQTGESILAQNALDLDSTKVGQHYIKLKDVTTISYKSNINDALEIFKETNYSRLPVEKDGQLIGIVLLKDIFKLKKGRVIDYMKNVPLVSANSILSSALEKMRSARAQMAFVVENNNSTDVLGIITIEDIIEEIVGEIYDEYDDDEEIYEVSLEKARVQSNVIMYDLFKQLEIHTDLLEDDEEDMPLRNYLLKHLGTKRLYKNSRFTLEDEVTFKVVEIVKNKKFSAFVEVVKL
ncbi:CNNM domain-containing protein [Mycoplasmopsis verecunda]|uniref:Hemolysin, contains CBS domains n=1 Tax=Mycoplasmopsis verecunda TaxID=171291 RepID=A0A1T4LCK1_9BACT|nr:CNNM domain-containing protein [Mycoplasmopsis verecunda]WPB54813.1 CNNM domain-containing protein [Mycoplasmopsis verecunda]SJZ52244.1 Hemolysin, contains CBS domains [Mycoplasmopsis verecunda]